MKENDFAQLAEYVSDVILHDRPVAKEISQFRKKFTGMQYCLPEAEAAPMVEKLLEAIK